MGVRPQGSGVAARRWLAVTALLASAQTAGAQLHDIQVSNQGERYSLSADITIAAPPAQVFKVLTDYNHLTRISGAIVKSRLLKRVDTHTALVYVETRACVMVFCRSLKQTQQVVELDKNDIVAQSLPAESNVTMGTASWHLQADGDGTRMLWRNTVEPTFWIPPLIGTAMMKNALRTQVIASAKGIEKLAREWAHLPPLKTVPDKHDQSVTQH